MTELLETSASQAIKVDPDKYLKARVTKVTFNKTYKACRSLATITGHHWPAGKPDGYKQSKKAAVLQLGKDKKCTATLTVKVDSKGISGKGEITGTLNNLTFVGEVPLEKGVHENVEVTLKETPNGLSWARGAIHWEIDAKELAAIAGRTLVELFFIFDDPAKRKFFKNKGVWVEALRFIFKKGRLEGTEKVKQSLSKVTKCCFTLPYHKYEIDKGGRRFGGAKAFGLFQLKRYMIKPPKGEEDDDEYRVNCYDQAYAVIVYNGALGVTVGGLFLDPFGYLKKTQLVGRGTCNNPFPKYKFADVESDYDIDMLEDGFSKLKPPREEDFLYIDEKSRFRVGFGNHMFCEYRGKIYDACAGPALGENTRLGYMLESIDTNTPGPYSDYPLTEADIKKNELDNTILAKYEVAHIYVTKLKRKVQWNCEVKRVE